MTTYTVKPGIAALVNFTSSDGKWDQSAIYMDEGDIILGHRTPMATSSLPQAVQDSINAHFAHVFSLEHETWRDYPNPSPRAVYCGAAQPWTIEVNE